MYISMCACLCLLEGETDRDRDRNREGGTGRERERERERERASERAREGEGEGPSVHLYTVHVPMRCDSGSSGLVCYANSGAMPAEAEPLIRGAAVKTILGHATSCAHGLQKQVHLHKRLLTITSSPLSKSYLSW